MGILKWHDDGITGMVGWQHDVMMWWHDDRKAGWQDDGMTGWQDGKMTWWLKASQTIDGMVYFINFISVQCTVQHKKGVIFAVNYIASLNTKNMHHTRVLILWFSINRELLYHNIIYHVIYIFLYGRGGLCPRHAKLQNMQIHLNCRKRIKRFSKCRPHK